MSDDLGIMNTSEEEMHGKYLTFSVGDGVYGIEIKYVTEIIGVQDITAVPRTNDYVKGIINLRGQIVPILDINTRFGNKPTEYTPKTCIVEISAESLSIGIIVDEVLEVVAIDDEMIQKPPIKTNESEKDSFVKNLGRVGNDVKQLLDINKILDMAA